MAHKEKQGRKSKKWRQSAHNKETGKYARAFARCVRRTGKWRGKAYHKDTLLPKKKTEES